MYRSIIHFTVQQENVPGSTRCQVNSKTVSSTVPHRRCSCFLFDYQFTVLSQASNNSVAMTVGNAAQPKSMVTGVVGRWNRKKRGVTSKHHATTTPKQKLTKELRRAKYTAIARDRQTRLKSKDMVCFHCRGKGHSIQHCPHASNDTTGDRKTKKDSKLASAICYKCGSTEHTLAQCPKRKKDSDESLPFATCFICEKQGHLASACPENEHGIYVNGGACKHCGSNQHRATDCPENSFNKKKTEKKEDGRVEEVDVSDLLEDAEGKATETKQTSARKSRNAMRPIHEEKKTGKKRRVVTF